MSRDGRHDLTEGDGVTSLGDQLPPSGGPVIHQAWPSRNEASPPPKKILLRGVGVWPRPSLLGRMQLLPRVEPAVCPATAVETIALSGDHLHYLETATRGLNPHMPQSFGLPHLIRALLDRIEESGIDLAEASSEGEIARVAARSLQTPLNRRQTKASGSSSSSCSSTRRSCRSSQPATDRVRSGKPPRSGRE